jgi:hypothetical protein
MDPKSTDRCVVKIPGGPSLEIVVEKIDWQGGRRLVFVEKDKEVFDSGPCVSLEAAMALGDAWLQERIAAILERKMAKQLVKGV